MVHQATRDTGAAQVAGGGRGQGRRPGPGSRSAPTRLTTLTVVWAVLYAGLRAWYATGHRPDFAPIDTDLVLFTGWRALVLPAAVAVVTVGLHARRTWSPAWAVAGWGVAALLVGACALTLLDLVGTLLWGLGIPHDLVSVLSRVAGLAGAALTVTCTVRYQRRHHGDCPACSRTGPPARWEAWRAGPAPRWAFAAAYLAVAGMLTRVGAQAVIGFGTTPFAEGVAVLVFDLGFVLTGSLLPLAMVHRWGRVWPRWVLPLAGRRVPRWLVAGPGLLLSGGLTAYFGMGMVQLVVEGVPDSGTGAGSALFLWLAVPAYLVWGVTMGVAAISYYRRTRPACRRCGR